MFMRRGEQDIPLAEGHRVHERDADIRLIPRLLLVRHRRQRVKTRAKNDAAIEIPSIVPPQTIFRRIPILCARTIHGERDIVLHCAGLHLARHTELEVEVLARLVLCIRLVGIREIAIRIELQICP